MSTTLDRAVEADEIVATLRGYGLTQANPAAVVGADRAVRAWTKVGFSPRCS